MRSTLSLPEEKLVELVKLTGAKTKTQAVLIAIEDEIKKRKFERMKQMAGKLDFEDVSSLRHQDDRLG